MLRVTRIAESASSVALKLEGRIVGGWVSLLERECRNCLGRTTEVVLDLSAVTFVDDRGVDMLRGLASEGVRIVRASDLVDHLLRQGGNTHA